MKRRLKNIVKTNHLPVNKYNFVILARDGASNLEFHELSNQIISLFDKFYKEEKIEKHF